MFRIAGILTIAAALLLTQGSVAAEVTTRPGVVDHVTYLASPELKGRKPMTRGSKKARTYIGDHFANLGLVPWGTAEGFEQSVLMGTNVVGVLPGGDPALKDEIVLISAHYDHLGNGHLGAADNAAGVAALLELASHLATAPEPPKRSIAFAAFDCEERGLWGSVCFSVREDFDAKRIAANINIDMLGRKAFDAMENTLFIAASHELPPVDTALAKSAQIDVLPVPSHVASARSDHAVFESLGIPVLFFSSGIFGDYHQQEDTLENLDLGLLSGSVGMIERAAAAAANASALDARPLPQSGTDAMLASVAKVQETMLNEGGAFALEPEVAEACRALHADTVAHLGAPTCDEAAHRDLMVRGITTLGPILLGYQYDLFDDETADRTMESQDTEEAGEDDAARSSAEAASYYLAALHNAEFFDAYREYARKVSSRSRLGLVLGGLPHQHSETHALRDDDYIIDVDANGCYRLSAILPNVTFSAHPRRFVRMLPSGFSEASFDLLYFEGTRDELIDYLLREWERPDFGEKRKDAVYFRLLKEITGEKIEIEFDAWKTWRWGQLGIEIAETQVSGRLMPAEQVDDTRMKSAATWQRRFQNSNNPFLRRHTFYLPRWLSPDSPKEHYQFTNDPEKPIFARVDELDGYMIVDVKNGAIYATPDMLSALALVVEDTTPVEDYETFLLSSFDWDALPLVGPVMREGMGPLKTIALDDKSPETLGHMAHRRLLELSGVTDVPPEREAWEAWLRDARANDPEGKLLPRLREISLRQGKLSLQERGGKFWLAFRVDMNYILPLKANLWSSGRGYMHKYSDMYRFRPPGLVQKMAAGRRLPDARR